MRKSIIYFFVFSLISFSIFSQSNGVGIGTKTPHATAAFEVVDTAKGMLIPRMTMNQRIAIQNPAEGLMVYQTDSSKGFWYVSEASWTNINAKGVQGNSGLTPLVKTTSDSGKVFCSSGGTKIEVGLDQNGNGILDFGEINETLTKYICNGSRMGFDTLVVSTVTYVQGTVDLYTFNANVTKRLVITGTNNNSAFLCFYDANTGSYLSRMYLSVWTPGSFTDIVDGCVQAGFGTTRVEVHVPDDLTGNIKIRVGSLGGSLTISDYRL